MPDVYNHSYVAQSSELTALFLFNLCQDIELDELHALIYHLERHHSLPVSPVVPAPNQSVFDALRN